MTSIDVALRGAVVALLALVALLLARDRTRLWTARIGVVFTLGLAVQVVSSTPAFESAVPRLWQAPLVAISVGEAKNESLAVLRRWVQFTWISLDSLAM